MTDNIRLLLVDDDRLLSPFVVEFMEAKGLQVDHVTNGEDGLTSYSKGNYDLLILDVKMPFRDGFSLAEIIRSKDPHTPIIFVTGEGRQEDRVRGLMIGADDYLVKPFSMKELYLRIRNQLKKSIKEQVQSNRTDKTIGQFIFRPERRELDFAGQLQSLTTIENRLLLYFLQSKDLTIDNEAAMRAVWDDHHSSRSRSLTVYVSKLRKYLSKDPNISILNVHGTGYRLSVVP